RCSAKPPGPGTSPGSSNASFGACRPWPRAMLVPSSHPGLYFGSCLGFCFPFQFRDQHLEVRSGAQRIQFCVLLQEGHVIEALGRGSPELLHGFSAVYLRLVVALVFYGRAVALKDQDAGPRPARALVAVAGRFQPTSRSVWAARIALAWSPRPALARIRFRR